MKYFVFIIFLGTALTLFYQLEETVSHTDPSEMSTGEILIALGDERIREHLPDTGMEKVSAERGKQLVISGRASKPGWGVTSRISSYFTCIACHNTETESSSLTEETAGKRLEYAAKHDLPYLQGSPFYGLVSRLTYYNGDYQEKYGDLAKKAHKDIRDALQLCATECSKGRLLKDWELESILAYFWTLDIPFDRLELNEEEKETISEALNGEENKAAAIKLIQSKYTTAYPATFIDPPKDRKKGNDFKGDVTRGELLYKHSCLHCHKDQKYSLYELDTSYMSLNELANRMPTYHPESVYQVARYGTQALVGKGAYMPNYTQEKMSRQQMADLRAYIFSKKN